MPNNANSPKPILLLTREAQASTRFVERMPAELRSRVQVMLAPLLEIAASTAIPDIDATTSVIFTSQNGVRFAPDGQLRTAYCVGPATTAAAKNRGWQAMQAGENAETLVASLTGHQPQGQLVHLSGTQTRGNVTERLAAAGLTISHQAIYTQNLLPMPPEAIEVLNGSVSVIVPLFSPRSAAHFSDVAPNLAAAAVVALSDAVAQEVTGKPTHLLVAEAPNANAIHDAIGLAVDRLEGRASDR